MRFIATPAATIQTHAKRRAGSLVASPITIVVPAYREAQNLGLLIDRIARVRETRALDIDVIVVDDDSRDGSTDVIESRRHPWVQVIVRRGVRGLSTAVLEGLSRAKGDVLVCMDADLSHPPETLWQMLHKLDAGADFVIGSRYIEGGSTSDDGGMLRWLNGRIAALLARPLTSVRDPMAGFFALRRSTFEKGRGFAPVGYKIGLELIVKCACERVAEVPIHFENRQFGETKLTTAEQVKYLQHLRRLYIFKYGVWSQLVQFLAVGALGTVVNLVALTAFITWGLKPTIAVALAILVAMAFNFALNRRFSFSLAPRQPWVRQFASFVAASSVGAVVNYGTTIVLLRQVPAMRAQLAALAGIAVGTAFNFVASRYLVFRASHVRAPAGRDA